MEIADLLLDAGNAMRPVELSGTDFDTPAEAEAGLSTKVVIPAPAERRDATALAAA